MLLPKPSTCRKEDWIYFKNSKFLLLAKSSIDLNSGDAVLIKENTKAFLRFYRTAKGGFQIFMETVTNMGIKKIKDGGRGREKKSNQTLALQMILLPYSLCLFVFNGWYID